MRNVTIVHILVAAAAFATTTAKETMQGLWAEANWALDGDARHLPNNQHILMRWLSGAGRTRLRA